MKCLQSPAHANSHTINYMHDQGTNYMYDHKDDYTHGHRTDYMPDNI